MLHVPVCEIHKPPALGCGDTVKTPVDEVVDTAHVSEFDPGAGGATTCVEAEYARKHAELDDVEHTPLMHVLGKGQLVGEHGVEHEVAPGPEVVSKAHGVHVSDMPPVEYVLTGHKAQPVLVILEPPRHRAEHTLPVHIDGEGQLAVEHV